MRPIMRSWLFPFLLPSHEVSWFFSALAPTMNYPAPDSKARPTDGRPEQMNLNNHLSLSLIFAKGVGWEAN